MDFIDLRIKLSELTEQALQENDLEALGKIYQVIQDPGPGSPSNFGEFFFSLVPIETIKDLK